MENSISRIVNEHPFVALGYVTGMVIYAGSYLNASEESSSWKDESYSIGFPLKCHFAAQFICLVGKRGFKILTWPADVAV